MRWAAMLAVALAACGGKGERPSKVVAGGVGLRPPTAQDSTPAAELPPTPPFGEAARGRLAAQSAGPTGAEEITGEWAAQAGICDTPPMLQVVAQEPGFGTIVLLALPAGNRVGSYPVTVVASGLPSPPAAQVGVQLFRRTGSFAYQASEGRVDVYAFGKTVSGRFVVTLREITSSTRIRYAGAFREVPVARLDPERCAPAAQDSAPGR